MVIIQLMPTCSTNWRQYFESFVKPFEVAFNSRSCTNLIIYNMVGCGCSWLWFWMRLFIYFHQFQVKAKKQQWMWNWGTYTSQKDWTYIFLSSPFTMCYAHTHGLIHDGRLWACPSWLLGLMYVLRWLYIIRCLGFQFVGGCIKGQPPPFSF
jgi:hypothetical protein